MARIVYIGAERVGLACLEQLIRMRKDLVGVFTAADELRGTIADFVSFDSTMAGLPVPYYRVTDTRSPAVIHQIHALRPEVILVISWSQRIPEPVLRCAPLGCIGLHYALLPRRRGGAPLNWALIDGLSSSGITLFYYTAKLDAGEIIAQAPFEIGREDTVKTLLDKIVVLAPRLVAESIERIEQGRAPRIPQDEALASYTRRRRPSESQIDWSSSKEELYNFIRALSPPYPPAFTQVGDKRLVIERARFNGDRLQIEGFIE